MRGPSGPLGPAGIVGCGLTWPNGAQVGNASIAVLLSIAYSPSSLLRSGFFREISEGCWDYIGAKMEQRGNFHHEQKCELGLIN